MPFTSEQHRPEPVTTDRRLESLTRWAKLLRAGLNPETADLPGSRPGKFCPFEMVPAITLTWLFSGQRSDESTRLRAGCIRWQHDSAPTGAPASRPIRCSPSAKLRLHPFVSRPEMLDIARPAMPGPHDLHRRRARRAPDHPHIRPRATLRPGLVRKKPSRTRQFAGQRPGNPANPNRGPSQVLRRMIRWPGPRRPRMSLRGWESRSVGQGAQRIQASASGMHYLAAEMVSVVECNNVR